MATKGSKKAGGSKGSAKKSSASAGAAKSSGGKGGAAKKGGASGGAAKKGGSKKGGGGGTAKSLISPKVKKAAGDILGAAAAGALKGMVEELVPKVEAATGAKPTKKGRK